MRETEGFQDNPGHYFFTSVTLCLSFEPVSSRPSAYCAQSFPCHNCFPTTLHRATMFKRLSRTFSRKKDSEKEVTNGYTNGYNQGASSTTAAVTNGCASDSSSDLEDLKETSATREDVQSTFEQYAQLIHAAQRPLPVQSGNGAYLEKEEPSSVWADIKSLGLKDVRTIRNMMAEKAAGKPQDDREMLMEHVIQVQNSGPLIYEELMVCSWWPLCLLDPATVSN